jgi:hypothetical protein
MKREAAMGMSLKRIRAARKELVKRGVLVDSGERRRCPQTGELQVVWKLNPELTEEQMDALVERPDTMQ